MDVQFGQYLWISLCLLWQIQDSGTRTLDTAKLMGAAKAVQASNSLKSHWLYRLYCRIDCISIGKLYVLTLTFGGGAWVRPFTYIYIYVYIYIYIYVSV